VSRGILLDKDAYVGVYSDLYTHSPACVMRLKGVQTQEV
jgi:hypothetical protein